MDIFQQNSLLSLQSKMKMDSFHLVYYSQVKLSGSVSLQCLMI